MGLKLCWFMLCNCSYLNSGVTNHDLGLSPDIHLLTSPPFQRTSPLLGFFIQPGSTLFFFQPSTPPPKKNTLSRCINCIRLLVFLYCVFPRGDVISHVPSITREIWDVPFLFRPGVIKIYSQTIFIAIIQ